MRGVVFGALTGVSYAGFILLLRHGTQDLRRPAGPLFDATWVAAVASLVTALALGVDDLAPAWPSAGWLILLALSSQVVGWLLISTSLPRLPAALTSMILTVQPVGSVVLGHRAAGRGPDGPAALRRARSSSRASSRSPPAGGSAAAPRRRPRAARLRARAAHGVTAQSRLDRRDPLASASR